MSFLEIDTILSLQIRLIQTLDPAILWDQNYTVDLSSENAPG